MKRFKVAVTGYGSIFVSMDLEVEAKSKSVAEAIATAKLHKKIKDAISPIGNNRGFDLDECDFRTKEIKE